MMMHIFTRSEQGFTLIEVIVALTVLSIGIIGLSVVFPLAMRDVGKSGSVTKAVQLCQQKLEEFQMLAYDSADLEHGYTHDDDLNPLDGVYERTWQVTDDEPITGCKLVEVTVSWQSRRQESVSLSTVIAQAGR
ncbi:MAG TPA: prepilin-type N-terminal cleavage/methylation domain-containing protein [bacterium]|nr:prepilin-type N-terminal cleavage/methylation domain-containing protein [bacterium]